MRWAVLTSDKIRHRHLANTLAARHDVAAVVVEPKKRDPATVYRDDEERALLEAYYAERDASEAALLGEGAEWRLGGAERITVEPGAINDAGVVARLKEAGVEACVVFGTSILKAPWFEGYDGRMLNIHLGLSPYYRGSGTNLWPLYDGRPELVGATLHQISDVVDGGAIYCQVRPVPAAADGPHDVGNKTIARAALAMAWLMGEVAAGRAVSSPMPEGEGREYRFRDFSADAVRVVLERFRGGMMAEYVRDAGARRRATPLVREWELA